MLFWKNVEMNESDNDSKNDSNVLKKINKWDHLFLTRKSKISISLKTSNNFSLILKSLLYNNNVKKTK